MIQMASEKAGDLIPFKKSMVGQREILETDQKKKEKVDGKA